MGVVRELTLGRKLRTAFNKVVTLVNELRTDHATQKSALDETKAVLGDLCLSAAGLAIGSGSKAQVLIANTVTYLIDGEFKTKTTAEVAFTATDHDIADGSEAVFVYSLNGDGDVTVTKGDDAVGAGNASIPDPPAGEAVIGHLRLFADGAIFNATTDELDAAHLTDTYTDVAFLPQQVTAAPATLTASAADSLES